MEDLELDKFEVDPEKEVIRLSKRIIDETPRITHIPYIGAESAHIVSISGIYPKRISTTTTLTPPPPRTYNSATTALPLNPEKLLMTGGHNPKVEKSKCFRHSYVINMEKGECKRARNMINGREEHRLIGVSIHGVFALGGKDKWGVPTPNVECYSEYYNEWGQVPKLNYPRVNMGVCLVGCIIYTFGGLDHLHHCINNSNVVEKFDVLKQTLWEVVQLKGGDLWANRQHSGCLYIDRNKILLFGGATGTHSYSDHIFLFYPVEEKIVELESKLVQNDIFYQSCGVGIAEENILIFGKNFLHLLDYKSGSFVHALPAHTML